MAISARGAVKRLWVTKDRLNVRLALPADEQPKDSYFVLEQSDSNYLALYSLALAAAMNGNELLIRTTNAITPDATAFISYMLIDW